MADDGFDLIRLFLRRRAVHRAVHHRPANGTMAQQRAKIQIAACLFYRLRVAIKIVPFREALLIDLALAFAHQAVAIVILHDVVPRTGRDGMPAVAVDHR